MTPVERERRYPDASWLLGIAYELLADPRPVYAVGEPLGTTNCRRLVQEFFAAATTRINLPPGACLSDAAYQGLGVTVWDSRQGNEDPFAQARFGDVVFADPSADNNGADSGYTPEQRLHLAIWLGQAGSEPVKGYFPAVSGRFPPDARLILHATNRKPKDNHPAAATLDDERRGVSALWTPEEFLAVYTPRRIRRLPELAGDFSLD
jgi:hypothetical protein